MELKEQEFKQFLISQLEPICDADPDVLADYVIALLKQNNTDSELKKICKAQLPEFLNQETERFVDHVFETIHIKGYLKGAQQKLTKHQEQYDPVFSVSIPASSNVVDQMDISNENPMEPIPSLDDHQEKKSIRARYENASDDDDKKRSGNRRDRGKRYRENDNHNEESVQKPRYQSFAENQHLPPTIINGMPFPFPGMPIPSFNGQQIMHNRDFSNRKAKGRCFSYDQKGYCLRGDACPYDHGPDVVVVERSTSDKYDPQSSAISLTPSGALDRGGIIGRGRGTRGRGRGVNSNFGERGTFTHDNNSLIIENIPAENCTVAQISEYFSTFGNIINISIRSQLGKAMIQYQTPAEAQAAYNSPKVIFDNRFVKVYWALPEHINELSASDINTKDSPNHAISSPEEIKRKALLLRKQKEQLILKQIEDQKVLMQRLENQSLSPEERASIMGLLKVISETLKGLMDAQSKPVVPVNQAETSLDPVLVAKLAALKEQAAQLGIKDPTISAPILSFSGRGRGKFVRGRGRGRGGAINMNRFTLDNRTRKIMVEASEHASTEAIREQFKVFGHVESFEVIEQDKRFIIQYKTRREAESAYARGRNVSQLPLMGITYHEDVSPLTSANPENLKMEFMLE